MSVFAGHERDAVAGRAAAERRAEQIRGNVADHVQLIAEGLEAKDWRTLGYDSPAGWYAAITDYHEVPVEIRRRLIAALRAEGYSLRGIGVELALSKDTVRRELGQVSQDETPGRVTGSDGKSYPAIP